MTIFFGTGFIGTTITHGRTPEPVVDLNRILAQGNGREIYSLYSNFISPRDVQGTRWLVHFQASDYNVHISARLSGFHVNAVRGVYSRSYQTNDLSAAKSNGYGYVYLGEYSRVTGKVIPKNAPGAAYPYINFTNKNRIVNQNSELIYDNGGPVIYLNSRQ